MSVFAGLPKIPVRAAMTLAQRGVPVFPCGPNKRPLTAHGFKDATTDIEQVKHWWRATPKALIGVPTGQASNLDVIDFDAKHGDPDELLDQLQMAVDAMFRGPRSRTQSGGYHQWFRHDPRVRIGASRFKQGVDWRGEGGYAIAPDGINYHLIADGEPEPMPESLVALIVAHQGAAVGKPALSVVGGTDLQYRPTMGELAGGTLTEGQWHDAMVRMVAIFVSRGFSLDEITTLAPMWQRAGYSLEQTIAEVRKAAEGAYAKWGYPVHGVPKASATELEFVGIEALRSRDPPSFQIAGVMPEKAFGYIYGRSSTLKTFVALDMALSIAYGRHWQGRPVKQGRVLYILGEGQSAFANRVRVWQQARNVIPAAPFWALFQPIQFTSPQDVGRLVTAIESAAMAPDWVVVDTVARNFGAMDPDKTQDMTIFVNAIDAVRAKFGCGVLAVHHAGKDETKGARNSSVLQASADFEIRTEREENDPAVTLVNSKAKDWEPFPRMRIQTRQAGVIDERTGEEVTSLVLHESGEEVAFGAPSGRNEIAVVGILKQRGHLSFSEIKASLSLDSGALGKCLRNLISKAVIAKTAETPSVFYLVERDQ